MEAKYLRILLEQLAKKTGQTMDTTGFTYMGELIEEKEKEKSKPERVSISGRYLQENILNRLQKGEKEINVRPSKANAIAQYLGYANFNDFVSSIESPLPKTLKSCAGNWYSYVRANSGSPEILQAPVRMWVEKNKLRIVLLGRERKFEGEVIERKGNVFAYLESGEHKALSIVLKVGISINPQVLQGVFSGISSNGDPICGREIFVRQTEKDFEKLHWKKILMEDVLQTREIDRRIIDYFMDQRENCIKINQVSSFDLNDLIARHAVPAKKKN